MVLIVGADPEEADLLQTLLAGDFPLLIANSRPEALDLARCNPVESAIVNFGGPLPETYDILQDLLDLREDIPILLISDSQHREAAMPLVQAGLVVYLQKPFNPSDLKSKVHQFQRKNEGQAKESLSAVPAAGKDISPPPSQEAALKFDPVSMDRLIMDLAHRLKNPLVAVRTFAHLLKERFNDPQFQRDFYQTMRQEVERMDTLIDQLIEFSELPDPRIESHQVLPTVEEAMKGATDRLKGARIDLRDDLDDKRPALQVDRVQLVYALVHLLTGLGRSKTKAGHSGISVCIRATTDPEGVEIVIQKKGPHFEDRSQFFGLELFMAKRIIERQQGSIEWGISPEGHTSVKIRLPISYSAAYPSHRAAGDHKVQNMSLYAERRNCHHSIAFRDRRVRERRLSIRSSYFPERRRKVPVAAQS